MRKRWTIAMMTTALVVSLAPSAQAAPTVTADMVRVTDTSAWSPASPDPTGLAFIPSTGALLISDDGKASAVGVQPVENHDPSCSFGFVGRAVEVKPEA